MDVGYYISRISSGLLRIRVSLRNRETFLIKRNPTLEVKYIAEEIYEDSLIEGYRIMMNQAEMLASLRKNGFWSDEKEEQVIKLEKDLENLKVEIYLKRNVKTNHDDYVLRQSIKDCYNKLEDLHLQKHAYDYVTAEGYANICKTRYLLRNSLFTMDGKNDFSIYDSSNLYRIDDYVDKSLEVIMENRIEEADVRRVARSVEWNQIWEAGKTSQELYGIPAIEMTSEQSFLYSWSRLYDSVDRNENRPRKEVIKDDYRLDGWLILEKRKIDQGEIENEYEKRLGSKVANSDEVFVVAQEHSLIKEVTEINSLNDIQAQMIKRQRMHKIKTEGSVNEFNMPDTKMKMGMMQNRMESR